MKLTCNAAYLKGKLPKGFKVETKRHGLYIHVRCRLSPKMPIDKADEIFYRTIERRRKCFYELYAESGPESRVWMLVDLNVQWSARKELSDARNALKRYFEKYGNSYADDDEAYEIVEDIRRLVETDEN